MKKHLSTIILICVLIIGLSLLLYPSVSDYWNSFHQSYAISEYVETVSNMDEDKHKQLFNNAVEYNKKLSSSPTHWRLKSEEIDEYKKLLDISGTGIIGQIEIPKISCSLPIYHGTEDDVLQIAVGHIPGSSLPIGGESSHSVLSGHRGLPSAKIFTNLNLMEIGDLFMIRVMNEVLTYEVDNIRIVEPDDFSTLGISTGEDLCTLVTCTPYGVNTHRLLVRGHRVENVKVSSSVKVTADAMQIEPTFIAIIIGVPLLIFVFVLMIKLRRKSVSITLMLNDINNS